MSTFFLDADGFHKKTFEELKGEYEVDFQGIFGDDIDLEPEGPFGQLVGMLAQRDANIWDGAEEIYNSRNPNSAEGVSLDNICAETGIIRQDATETVVQDVRLFGDESTVVTAGKKVKQANSDIEYELDATVTITKAAFRYVEITFDPPSDTEVFTVTIDGTPYTDTATVPPDDEEDIAENIRALIAAGSWGGTVSRSGATLTLIYVDTDSALLVTSNITIDLLASGGDFTATTAGANTLPANSLNTIVTAVSGWDSVINPVVGLTGRDVETDEELRIRRANTPLTGNATDDAILLNISNNVSGVTSVTVTSNRTDATDGDGRPPHSFEAVVVGGADADIAQQIWDTQPSGIASYGNDSEVVVDSQGNNQTVYFSRTVPMYIWVKVKRDLYSEETYPAGGDDAIKQAIVDWAAINQPIGKDVIRQRLSEPVYSIPGIEDIEITIDGDLSIGHTPSYALQNIVVAGSEIANFATSRIIVEDLTP
jgi:uncharacterized phage protein gp47/JayE